MEESGKTIREETSTLAPVVPPSWLCDANDRPVVEYIHANDQGAFRIKVGALTYERFSTNGAGEWLYRRVK